MSKHDIAILALLVLLVAGWIGWVVLNKEKLAPAAVQDEKALPVPEPESEHEMPVAGESTPGVSVANPIEGGFAPPTVAIVNGRAERTIHMGVRQYAWDPSTLTVKKGELVRLIVHNADVQHGLVIPELNVLNIDIPPEGAVIEFEATKAGTFVFFCSYYCGEGHSEMRGKIIVEE